MFSLNQYTNNQLQLKLLNKSVKGLNEKVNLNLNLYKLSSVFDSQLIEALFLLEFYSGNKAFVYRHKKTFKEINIQVMNTIRSDHLQYFFDLMRVFYIPIMWRRSLFISSLNLFHSNYSYTIRNINQVPGIPDVYFKWSKPINGFFNFYSIDKDEILLYIQYLGFLIRKEV